MKSPNHIVYGSMGTAIGGRDRVFDGILKRVKSQRVRANLDAFVRSLADDDADSLSASDENSNRRIHSERIARERGRLAKLVEHDSYLCAPAGDDLDRIALLSCRRVSHRCGARAKGSSFLKPRNFALRKKLIRCLRAEYWLIGSVPNPYYFGCYYCIVEALAILGANRYHAFDTLRAEVEELMGGTRWRVFVYRESPRHRPRWVEDVQADASARLHYNCRVLQRTKSYGLKLLQVGQIVMGTKGCVIDIIHRAGQMRSRSTSRLRGGVSDALLNRELLSPELSPIAGSESSRIDIDQN